MVAASPTKWRLRLKSGAVIFLGLGEASCIRLTISGGYGTNALAARLQRMHYMIPAGIAVSYVIFWFAMKEPVGSASRRLREKLLAKVGRGHSRIAKNCDVRTIDETH
jgi:hypothetical protein